jgi:hypothetical protein
MPYVVRKVSRKNCYSVKGKKKKRTLSKCTTLKKAKAQIRLLNAIDHNPNFVLRKR